MFRAIRAGIISHFLMNDDFHWMPSFELQRLTVNASGLGNLGGTDLASPIEHSDVATISFLACFDCLYHY